MENKCESAGFSHAWEDITSNIVYLTYPPQYPPRQEKCLNCDLKRTFREKTEKWIEYSDGKERGYVDDSYSIKINGDSLTGGSGVISL